MNYLQLELFFRKFRGNPFLTASKHCYGILKVKQMTITLRTSQVVNYLFLNFFFYSNCVLPNTIFIFYFNDIMLIKIC